MTGPVKVDRFADGYAIERAANGFVVRPPIRYSSGECSWFGEMYVFADITQLAAWLIAQNTGGAK